VSQNLRSVYLVNRSPYVLHEVAATPFRPSGPFDFEATGVGDAPDDAYFGGVQIDWNWGLPGAFQALAEPRSGATLPSWTDEHGYGASSYWFTLHYLLMYRLGWRMPGVGLARWLSDRTKTDDPVLQLVAEVWGRDGFLLDYIAWALTEQAALRADRPDSTSPERTAPAALGQIDDDLRFEILQARRREGNLLRDGDSLHLRDHGLGPLNETDSVGRLFAVDPESRSAHFESDRAEGWYRTLDVETSGLPDLGNRSWHVDVHVRGLGHLGTYRKSRQTGIWFTGKHSVHILGN
jgi:hypothetical protein